MTLAHRMVTRNNGFDVRLLVRAPTSEPARLQDFPRRADPSTHFVTPPDQAFVPVAADRLGEDTVSS